MRSVRPAKYTSLLCVCSFAFFLVLSKSRNGARETPRPSDEVYLELIKNVESHHSFPDCHLSEMKNSCDIKINVLVTGVSGFVGSHVAEKVMKISRKITE